MKKLTLLFMFIILLTGCQDDWCVIEYIYEDGDEVGFYYCYEGRVYIDYKRNSKRLFGVEKIDKDGNKVIVSQDCDCDADNYKNKPVTIKDFNIENKKNPIDKIEKINNKGTVNINNGVINNGVKNGDNK